ncbi:ATP-binding protein [Thalassospira profundimaris]|nr:ATP-binding protein [Thalassospira profundimaris]
MRVFRSNMAVIVLWAIIIAVFIEMFPAPSRAHDRQQHFVIGNNGPASDITLDHFLTRLTTSREISIPADVINIPETEFETIYNRPGPGYTDQPVWYRAPFIVESRFDSPGTNAFIELGAAYLNDILLTVLSRETGKVLWEDRVGDRVPNDPGAPANLKYISLWPELAPGHYWLVIRVVTNSAHVLEAKLQTQKTFIAETGSQSYRNGSYLGVLLVVFALYMTFGVFSRDASVSWYAIYILGLFLLNLGTTGYAQLLFKDVSLYANDLITGTGTAISIGSSVAMWAHIIRLDKHNPFLFRVMMGLAGLMILGALTSTSDLYIYYAKLFFIPHTFLLFILLGYLIATGYRENNTLMYWFFLLALGFPTLSACIHLLMLIGSLPINSLTSNIYKASSTIHLVMVAIAMGVRVYRLAHKRIHAYQSNQRASQLAGEQRTFITMLSHEFRTPLAIIQRSSEILGLHMRDEDESVHNRLTTIRRNAGQLSALVDAFLTKETLDSATFTTSREQVAIDQFLTDLIARRSIEVQEQNVSLINADFAIVNIDRILLERAIINIIENARKYAPGAPVWIACNRSANGYVYIRIVDEGPGIAPDELGKVQNAFYRGRESSVTQGVGLGLHITNRIIEAHKGSMSLSVGEHGGTTVLLKLPYNLQATAGKTNEIQFGLSGKLPLIPSDKRR